MQDNKTNRDKLYTFLTNKGVTGIGANRDEFETIFEDEEKQKKLYDFCVGKGYTGIGKDYDEFAEGFSVQQTAPEQNAFEGLKGVAESQGMTKPINGNIAQTETDTLKTFGEGVKQGADALWQGGKYAVGEWARVTDGSQRDYQEALKVMNSQNFDASTFDLDKALEDDARARFEKEYADYRKVISQRRKEREGMGFFEGIKHKMDDPEMPTMKSARELGLKNLQHQKPLILVKEALEEAGGDAVKAREIIEEKAGREAWSDRTMREASEALDQHKPVEGWAWWGQLLPQTAGQAAALGANLIPGVGRYAGPALAYATTAGLTLSSAGSAMNEARQAGASDEDVFKAGLAQAIIEYGSEKIPLDRLMGRTGAAAFKKGYKGAVGDAAEEELERLLTTANKKLGGKLLSGKTAKALIKDMGVEGASEFVAEGLGTFVPIIYEDPENYPTLRKALLNGWEGAKAGIAMGGFLGGGSLAITNRAHNARRKKQGHVVVAEDLENGVVEVLSEPDDNGVVEVLTQSGEVVQVDNGNLGPKSVFTYEEWKDGEIDTAINREELAFKEGFSQEPTGANALNAMTGYDMARQEVARALGLAEGDDVDVFLNGRTAEDIAKGDTDVENAVKNYQQQKARMEGIQEKFQQTREQQYEESDRSIQANDNNGMVYATQLKDEPVFITGGNVVLNEDGTIDVDNSSEILYVKFPDGHVEMTSPDKFTEVFTSDRTADLKAAKRAEIDERWKAEFDAAEAQSVEQEKRDSGVVFDKADAQGNHRIEILNEGEDMSNILFDGAETEIPTEELNRWKQEAGIQTESAVVDNTTDNVAPVELPDVPDFFRLGGNNYSVASRNDDGSVDVMVNGKRETLPAGTDYSTHKPTDKKGEVQYEKMPVERTHEYFVQKVKDDEARAEMIEKRRKKAEAERKKFDKKPDPGIDPDAYEAKMTQWEADKKAAQAKVDYWNEVAKRDADITRSETREAVENIKPDVMEETADEFIANQLAGIKITPESFKRETGLSNAEQAQLVGVISNDGVSVERAAEIILENYDSELAGLGFTGDVQDVRDIIIGVLSQGNPRSYAKKGREAREAENMDQQRADAEVWAKGAFHMTLDELYLYEETILPRMMRDYEGFDENEYYSNLAENNGYDTTRESESISRGGELLQGEQPVPAGGTPVVGQRNEGGAVSDDVQGGGQNGVAQEEVPVNEPVGNSEQLSSSEIPNNQSVAEGDAPGNGGVQEITNDERVEMEARIVDWLSEDNLERASGKTRDEIFDEFGNELEPIAYIPTQYISLVNQDLKDQRIYCGKGYFIDHALRNHAKGGKQLNAEDVDVSKYLNIQSVLDNPDSVKETYVDGKRTVVFIKKIGRYFAELTQVEEDGKIVLHKSMFDQKKEPYAKLDDIRSKGTSSEGGVSSISHTAEAAPAISLESRGDVVSNSTESSASEDRNSVSNSQENVQESGEIAENGGEIQETAFLETLLDNGDKKITGLNSHGEVATVTIERDGKVVSVDSYDEGVLFEHTEYDGNGKATAVTRYDKQGNVVGTQVYEDGKAKTPMQKLADQVLARAEEKRRIPLRERARELEAQVGVKANIIESVDEVADPEARRRIVAGQNVAGWYSKGEVYLYMPNLQDRREIELTYVHEVVAHHGVKKLLGERFNEFLDGVWNMMSEADRARMLAYVGANENPTLQDMRAAADEYVAELAEKMNLGELEQSTWDKIVDWFKELLEKAGFENLTKEDIESMLKASYANLRSTEQGAQSKENDFRAKMTFHGSGAKFDRFDHAFMGTGEGAQVFGWGTYVTEVEGIGKQYAEAVVQDKNPNIEESVVDIRRYFRYNPLGIDVDTIEDAKRHLDAITKDFEGTEDWDSVVDDIEDLRGLIVEWEKLENAIRYNRNLYTVEIPDDNGSNYLHWEDVVPKKVDTAVKERLLERLSEGQGEAYKSDLKQELDDVFRYSDFDGASLYRNISAYLGGDKQASLFLNDMGFVGISYPADATTGGRADGARNYVIFNENDAQIKDRTMFRKKDSERRQEKRRINDAIDTAAGFITVGGKKQATKNRLKKEAERKQLAKEMYSSVLKGDFNDVTLSQIDKFIEDATPANPFGRRISQRLPQRMERALRQGARTNAVDALFSRICESTVPANERFSEAGRREIEERKKELLKGWAIATGNWHTDLKEFTDDTEPIGEGKDSKVYMSKDGNSVIKASKGKPFGKKFRPDIDNIPLFNDVFKNSRYEILGYGEIDGQFVRILKQDFIDFAESTPLTPEERKEYMGKLGFKPLNKDYTAFSNGEIVIADLQKSNIVKDAAGNISVIDADAKLHTKDVGGDYTYPPVEDDLPEQETRFRIANENQEIFVSNAQRAVEGIQQNKATAEQWIAMLKKNGGLKAGEDAWLGLEEWLNEKQGAVTKQEILDYIAQNRIQIEEVNYTQFGYGLMDEATRKLEAELKEIGWDAMVEKYPGFDELFEVYNGELLWSEERASVGEYEDFIIDNKIVDLDSQSNAINETREKYTTDGLERKREIALTVPTIEPYNESDEVHFGDAGNGRAVAWVRFGETTADTEETITAKKAVNDYLAEMREKYNTLEGEETDAMTTEEIKRLQELTAEEIESGEKKARVLVIDEIQSKRHQEGREKGYRGVGLAKEVLAAEEEVRKTNRELTAYREPLKEKYNFKELGGSMSERLKNFDAMISEEERITMDALGQARNEAEKRLQELREQERGIPSAPFEKNWHELAMKRMLRLAAEEGFDKVAWTTGEQQAERYNIGAVLKGLKAYKTSANEYYVIPYNNGVIGEFVKEYTEQELADTFGKELAQKIIANAENATEENPYEIEGEELRVGGEGMKGFYDKMLPSFVQKYTKKWGAKVGEVTMPSLGENNTMWSVDVTPEMQESVMQGQTMFRKKEKEENIVEESNKNVSLYRTEDGKVLRYEQLDLFDNERTESDIQRGAAGGTEAADNRSGTSGVQREDATGRDIDSLNIPLRPLEKGEVSRVQRVFTKSKAFDFTAGERIESLEDVAYIFKNLEDESVENTFAVLVKDERPIILHLGMGHYTASIVNLSAISVAVRNMNPDKIYFVHNHPSGALKASTNDLSVWNALKEAYGDIVEKGIIINLKSGKFGVFDQTESEVRPVKEGNDADIPVELFAFNKQVFDKDYNPEELYQAKSQEDVAAFISSNRLGERSKVGVLVCNPQLRVVGNVFTPFTGITSAGAKKVAEEVVYYTTIMGGTRPILFGNFPTLSRTAKSLLEQYISIYSGGSIKMADIVDIKSGESVINEPEETYGGEERVNEGTERNNRTVVRETLRDINAEAGQERARTEAEGAGETRFSTRGEGIDNVPTQPMTLMERITNSLLEVSAKNKENLELRASALRTFGRDINRVLSLMKAQREYDKSTVDTLVKLAKMYFQNAQLLGEVTPYEVARIMGVLNRSVGKRDISTEAAKLMDILLDAHTNALAGILDKAEKIKAKKVNAAGVEVMGRLDKYGQKRVDEYRAAKGMTPEKLEEAIFDSDNRLAELEQRVREVLGIPDGDVDLAAREYTGDNDVVNVYMDERARLEGLTLAREYKESIQQVQEEIKDLKQELKQAEEDYRLGNIDGKSLKEFRKSVAEAIMESKAELIEGYHSLIYKFQENTKESSQRAKEFAQAQIDRAREIQQNANSDMEGIPADTQGTHPDNHNNAVMNALRSPFPTFQGMLKKFGEKNVEGKGYLYERFMPQATQASDSEFRGKVAARVMIEAKLKEIYGEKANIARFMKELREYGATVTYREGNEMKQFDLTKGQMLYIYMVNKMADGQMKLRRMGITDDVVAELMTKLPEEAVQFADWAQNELLKDLRGKYNAVHERVFGAPMAAIENYFPIKIRKEARGEKGDVSEVGQEGKPSTVTGSIIKRTKNATAIDLSADAMQVLMEHIDDMEHWAAFAEFNRDLNVLLNYKHFQNQVKNMTSVRYGSGEEMWKNFKKTAQIVSGTYRPSDSSIDRAVQNIAKGLTRSKINFRLYTAIKQLLSAPAFWTDAGVEELAYCYANPKGSFKWALENLPGFAERWQGRTMGNEKLLKSDSDWELWRNEFVEKATRWGMTPNAAIDALTVAQGARAVYMTKLEQFNKAGYTEQRANEKALQAAAEAYNESQQSSEGMYLSPLQVEGTVASAIFSTFKNSNFGYTRKTAQAIANIKRKMRKGYKEETIAFMTKQMIRDGLSEADAKKMAEKVYNKSKYRDVANVAMFGFGLNLLWEAGGMAIYLLLGDDDEEKEKMMKEIALRGSLGLLNGVPFGETMISAAMAVKEGDTKYFRLPELVAVSDIKNLAQVLNYDPVRGANDIVNMLTSMGVGVTPQVLTDILVAFGDVEEFSAEELGMFVARFMNAPQSNLDRLMVDDAMEDSAINADEIMRRYAEYKKSKNAPITQFLYPDAIEQKALERYMKRFNKMLDERLENVVEDNDAYDLFYEGADARMKSELAKMRQKYLAEDKAEVFEKMDARELVERVLYGSGEINEAYFNLSTAEDEDNAFVLKSVLKELNDLVEEGMQTDEEERLLKDLKQRNNAINYAKRLMKQQPDKAQEHMNNIREKRAEAIKLINNYRKDE